MERWSRTAAPRDGSRSPAAPAESGVALLIVLVVLFIVAVLMVDISLTATTARRSAHNASTEFLMDAAIEGHFQVAAAQILYDQTENTYDGGDDRWARDEYNKFESKSEKEKERDAAAGIPANPDEEEGVRVLGDSDQISVTTRIEDEERKFNLNLLLDYKLVPGGDADKSAAARERFAVLLDLFREDTPLDLSRTRADELKDKIVDYINREAAEGDPGKIPLAKTGMWHLLTPDELRNAEGLEDRDHGMPAEGILYDAREPKAVKAWMEDPENVEPPKVYPGLLRYVTLWSGPGWSAKPPNDTWKRLSLINLNTAEKPVLQTLFYKNPGDFTFVDKIIDYRSAQKEDSKTPSGTEPKADEPLPEHQYFQKFEDLKKVDGLEDGSVLTRNGIDGNDGNIVTFSSNTFSVDILAEREETAKQVRFVIRRNDLAAGKSQGYQTLLREERADPRFEQQKPGDEAADAK